MDLTQSIEKAGASQQVEEFQYPDVEGFYVKLAFASKFNMRQIRELSVETGRRNRVTGEHEEKLNEEKLRKGYVKRIVKGWRGLTAFKMQDMVPGFDVSLEELKKRFPNKKLSSGDDVETAMREIEIPFDETTAGALIDNSMDFETWIIDVASDPQNYSRIARQKKREYENLK